ncbi:MAG: hypothetical protein FJ290_28520, partial [Planctomycetes bacterium]|nr:hypothetical protein [Planctomycetota bacterium]
MKVLSMRTAKRLKAAGPRGGSYIADKGKQFVCVSVAAKLEDDMGVNSLRKSLQVKAKVAGRAETFTSQGEGDDRQGYNSGVVFTVLTHWKKLQPKTKGKEGGDEP